MKASKHQLKLNESYQSLPSLQTIITRELPTVENHYAINFTLETMVEKLENLSAFGRQELTTGEWIEHIWENDVTNAEISEDSFTFILMGEQISFTFDDLFLELLQQYIECPFLAAYHYSLNYSSIMKKVIMKRECIKDCFTLPYNSHFIRYRFGR